MTTEPSNPSPKRRRLLPILLGAIVLCVVLAFIGALLSPDDQPAAPAAAPTARAGLSEATEPAPAEPTAAPVPTATPQPVATPTLEQHILAAIGDSNRQGAPAPIIEINDEQVIVTYPANDNLTVNMMRSATQRQILAIARAVRDNTGNSRDLRVHATNQLIDAYGNASEDPIIRVNLSRATLEKINFDGIQPDNLPLIADIYWQHPALDQ